MLTPQPSLPQLAAALGLSAELCFKREDLHPYGSHKGRSVPLMIKEHCYKGYENFVISSSGNAALAAIRAVKDRNENHGESLLLTVFVGENIDSGKLKMLKGCEDSMIKIIQVANPKQSAFQMEKEGKAKFLRQSTDDAALIGYKELAKELAEIPSLSAVFIPTSSGTTAQGLYEGFKELGINPQIHIVQTEACHPMVETRLIASLPARRNPHVGNSIASAIVDHVAHRKQKVLEVIKNSHGAGWVVSDEEITSAMNIVKKTTGIEISPNSALSMAGLRKAIEVEAKWKGAVVCLITGK